VLTLNKKGVRTISPAAPEIRIEGLLRGQGAGPEKGNCSIKSDKIPEAVHETAGTVRSAILSLLTVYGSGTPSPTKNWSGPSGILSRTAKTR